MGQYIDVGMDQIRYYLGLLVKRIDTQIALLVTPKFNNGKNYLNSKLAKLYRAVRITTRKNYLKNTKPFVCQNNEREFDAYICLLVKDMKAIDGLILQALSHNLGTPLGERSVLGEINVKWNRTC